MTIPIASTRISIDAASAGAALLLEKRLRHLHPTAVGHGSAWRVHLEDCDDRIDEIEATVAHWLRDVGVASSEMRIDDTYRIVYARAPAAPGFAPDYEAEPVLEHEP